MKRQLFILSFVLLSAIASLQANGQSFEKGTTVINAGLGTSTGTNIIGTVDYGIADNISVGAGLWYQSISLLGLTASNTSLMARGLYHFGDVVNVDKFDLYGGAEFDLGLSKGSGTVFALLPGARYYFTEKIGAFAELPIFISGGGSQFRFGVAIKLN